MYLNEIAGVWKLKSYVTCVSETGKLIYPYGINPIGYILYSETGFVSVHIMSANRIISTSESQEKIESAENYGGYIGKYQIDGNIVTHYPEVCNFLSYIQVPQKREFKISKGELTLEYEHSLNEYTSLSEKQNIRAFSKVIWRKQGRNPVAS